MASLFDKIKDIFKPNTQTTTPAATQKTTTPASSTPSASTGATQKSPWITFNRDPFGLASTGTTQPRATAPTKATTSAKPDSVFKPKTQTYDLAPVTKIGSEGSLSQRAIKNGQSKGEDWSKASTAQKKYNETYYRTLDNPTHTKMYTDLEKANSKNFQELYKSGREKLDAELKDVGKQYGKNSNEYKALKQFAGDYEILGQNKEISRATKDSRQYSTQLDDSIRQIYGGLMNRPDFQEKVAAGREAIGKNQQELHAFELATKNATQAQKDLLLYIRETEGNKGVQKFMASSLGQMLNAANANQIYADTVAKDSDALRTAGLYGQAIGPHIGTVVPDTASFVRGLTGKDADDPDDKNLGGGYTISDSVDDFLRSQLAGDLAEAGVDQEQFDAAAKFGLDGLSTKKEDWVKDMLSDASDYQKKYLGFLYAASGEEVAKSAWQGIKQQEQVVWDVAKKGSNRVSRGTDDALGALAYEYYGLGGAKIPGRDETVPQFLMSAMQSGAEQIVPALTSGLIGSIYTAAGAAPEVIKKASRIASTIPFSTMIAGRSYNEASQKENVTRLAALVYGAVEAMMEGLTEYGMGVAGGAGGALTRGAKDKLAARITSPVLRALLTMGVDALGEGEQERIQEAIEPIISSLLLHEGDLGEAVVGAVDPRNILDSDRMYAGALGAATALLMGPVSVATDISNNRFYSELGKSLNAIDALSKTVDVILNTDLSSAKIDTEALEAAKKTARIIKDGGKVSDLAVGKMVADFGKAGGDLSHLVHPETQAYNKETLTVDNLIAGAKSMLVELGGDAKLAEDIVKASRGEQISQETWRAIQADTNAMQVLTQLQGELDMSKDTALSRAARASTRAGTGNQVYDTLKAENTDKTIATPAAQRLYEQNVEWDDAQQIGGLIDKVMSGVALTEDEAKLISVGIPAVRSVIQEITGVELSESSTIGAVMTAMNDFAAQMAKTKEMQAAVKESTKQTARMPIPPAATGNSIGGIEISHDEFIQKYMARNKGVTLEEAEAAWNQRRMADAALSGEEENNGRWTIPGNPEGRNVGVAPGGTVSESDERGAGSERPADTGGTEESEREDSVREERNLTRVRGAKVKEVVKRLNAEQRDFVKECRDDGFASVTLVRGPLYFVTKDGKQVPVNALVNGNGDLVIRWDNPKLDPRKVANHERIHLWLSQFTTAERRAYVSNALYEIFGDDNQALTRLYELYAKKYAKSYSELSPEAFKAAIFEEILADMYAGINMDGAPALQQQTEMYVENSNLRGGFFGEDIDDGNYGESFERFNVADPFRDSTDWDIPSDVRPYPGEEPMHEQLPRLSISSMAEGGNFDLQYNDAGQPYALIDRDTGKQVTNVTAGMMVNTPLGNIVEMAVDNGNITEDEAKVQLQMLADAMNMIVKYNDAAVVWEMAGSQLFSAIKSNSDKQYNKTIDFSTICKKTMAIVDAMSETMKRLGRGLTRREVEAVYLETGKAGEATPCPVCYVFSRWMGIGNLLDQMSKFQDKYAGKSEEELVSFMKGIEDQARAYAEAASASKKKDFYDAAGNLKIGKVISDMKSKPNSKAAAAVRKLNMHQQANAAIAELTAAMGSATPEQQARWKKLIKSLKQNVLKDYQITELQMQMEEADSEVEVFEVYQWLAKTVLMSDASEVNEDGEAIGGWKKNPDFKPVPKDILFDLNRGGDFAKDYPLSWSFRTGKGCAMGKAITPYADARVGETIQGVAMDVKNIRVGADINEFLNGDTKKQQKTLESARKKQKQQNLIGGMRYQSTSDFRYEFGSDYLMTFFEMQALGANVQLYTKVIEAVDFLASTGADCNLSVMPLGDGYVTDPKTGKKKLVFSNVTGINAEAAIKKAKQYDNVQLILVGINDENIRLALEGTDVTFVIPFHGSGQSVHQVQTLMDLLGEHLDVTQAQDYTSVQSDHVSPNQTTEQKAMWDLRMAIIMGECADGLTAEQQALLNKNPHLQKLYDMFYVDETAPAYQNFLAKDQAEHIFPYEYWNREGDYEHADENGRVFQDYCKSMGIIPRFSGRNSKGERTGFGDFTKDKGYWKLLIDRSMYENVYDANGEWIGYGKYRDQQQINMSNVKLSDLDPETGKAQFTNGEMSKQYDATHNETDRQNLDTIVTNSIQRIEAMRDKGDVFDKTQVTKGFRPKIMQANAEIRGMDNDESIVRASVAGDDSAEETVVYIKDGYNRDTGETVDFINAILDGRKKGETRRHNRFPYKNWVGLAKGKEDGKVYGRVKFGKPYPITNQSPEYQDALIAGTDYDLADGESKWYYPVLEIEDFRDNPKPFRPIAQTGKYQRNVSTVKPPKGEKSLGGMTTWIDMNGETIEEQGRNQQPDVRFSIVDENHNDWAPEFYSKMERVIDDWTNGKGQPLGAKMAANQVVGWLKGKGVKSEEIKWSGIVPYLEGKKTVTKEELQQVMAENEVKIETKVLDREFNGEGHYYQGLDPRDGSERDIANVDALFDYIDELTKDLGLKPGTLVPKPDPYDASVNVINRTTGELITHIQYQEPSVTDHTHWSQYTLPGGENYREILFKMPAIESYTNRAMSTHWDDDTGVIAHTRVQDMGDIGGGKVLFVEEIQSDLHNEGANKGFEKSGVDKVREYEEAKKKHQDAVEAFESNEKKQAFDLAKDLYPRWRKVTKVSEDQAKTATLYDLSNWVIDFLPLFESDFNSSLQADKELINILSQEEVEVVAAIRDKHEELGRLEAEKRRLGRETFSRRTKAPDVPFAGTANTYHELVMKHLLRLAAEGDYDAIAWTTAGHQKERWENAAEAGYGAFEWIYDTALPKFMNKYGKQWGAKVSPTMLDNGEEVWSVDITPEMKDSVLHEGQPRFSVAPDEETTENQNTSANPYKEGTFEYTVYDMLGKINSPQELQDYINGLREKQQQGNEARNTEPGLFPKRKLPPVNEKEQQIRRAKLDELIEKYGAFKQGEKAARKYPIPEKVSDTRRVNRGVRTIVEAKAIPDRLAERLGGEVLVNELLTYEPITDSDALSRERSELARLGYEKALKEWESKSGTDRFPTKYDIAFGGLLLRQAANNGDDAIALRIVADLAAMERQAGQVSQAGRLLKQLGPVGQLYYVKKAIDRLNHQNEGRIAKGSMQPIVIDPDLAEAVVTAKEQKDIDDAMDELIQSIADQLPVTMKDRWDAWRYLSMLGNPRTHIRNYLGNAIFTPVRFAKDILAAAGESMFIKDESQRTKDFRALVRDPQYSDIREFAKADYKEMEPYLTGTGKMNPLNEIMNKRKVLPGVLDKISRKNDDWLTGVDAHFLQKTYVSALTQFIAARGVSLEDLSADVEGAKILNEARKYAALEAQKATYRDFSQAAAKLNALKRGDSFGSWLLDGVMPFTKTPINILKRGVEYSPIGLAKALTVDLNRVKNGDITAAEAIDHAAAGLTGTGVAVLGWLLASLGMARGGPDDDDKKDALEKAQGHQDYALEIDGKSYTIDWMAPVALPFFVGVEAQKVTSGDGPSSFFDFVNAMMLISEPMTSLSMLEGINSTLSAVRQGEPSEAIMTVLTNAAANYLSQGVPTFAGQIARTADPYRRSTYVDKNSETPAWMQRFLQGVQGKVPGLADNKMTYVDTWGRKDTNESAFLRGIENFISPGYANKIHETPVDTELLRLYEATGDNSMLPGTVAKYFQVEGETLNLTADQYEEFKTVTGKTAFELIGGLLGDVAYNGLDDQNKAKVIQQALKIATAVGKQKVAPTYQTDGWIQRAIDHDNTETSAVYHTLEGLDTGLSNYQLISAMDWLSDDERGKLIMAEHPNTNRNMTDYNRKKYKFVLTDDQIKREREIYEGLFWPEYAALLSNPKYINGDTTTRAELIKTMQSNVSTDARKALGSELRAAGYTSVLLDDSDVPDQVANLYDLLNRG